MKNIFQQMMHKRPIAKLAHQVKAAVEALGDPVPILVVSYNNGVYVDHCVRQLNAQSIQPVVIDNASNDAETRDILAAIAATGKALVVRSPVNLGARAGFHGPVYDVLPDTFGYTDPDLLFNECLPVDFIHQLIGVCDQFKCFKAGFALPYQVRYDLTDKRTKTRMGNIVPCERLMAVAEWEARFWTKPLKHDQLELYAASIDTTFAIYHKQYYNGDFFDAVRVAGDFSALHMPWFPDLDLLSRQRRSAYLKGNKSSNWVAS
ncbi:MAG: hypothetical protein LZF84_08525, partial [Nitrosomonas sp.]